ncbi:MAG: hypothetical protein WCR42_13995 [bacterium]
MIKKLLTTFAVLTIMTAFAMAQNEPIINSGTITNKGTIKVTCVNGSSVLNQTAGIITNDADATIQLSGDGAIFTNATGATVTNNGLLQFVDTDPLFANSAAQGLVTNAGTIQFDGDITTNVITGFGASAADRIGGVVKYNSNSLAQVVQGDTYYTNLRLSLLGDKTFTDGASYYVSASYDATGSGDRTYGTSIFNYDGASAQDVFAESNINFTQTTNHYYNLQFTNAGTKTIKASETVAVEAVFGDAAASAVTMADGSKMIYNAGIAATITGAITGTNATIQATTGAITITAGTGSVTLGGTGDLSLFEIDGATVTNAGTMTFNDGKYNQKSGTSTHSGTLALTGGDYVQVSGNVELFGTTTINSANSVYTQTAGLITIGTATAGTMTVTNGKFDINGTTLASLVRIDAGGTLALAAVAGVIDMADNSFMEVDGRFTNAAVIPTNLLFNANSTVTYDAGLNILATTFDNSFGNLTLTGVAKTHSADVYVDGNFSLSDADLDMGTTNKLVMTDVTKSATYEEVFEVTGNMARYMQGSENTALTFNNTATTIMLTDEGTLDVLTLNVTPDDNAYFGYTADDVKRSIKLGYTQTDWIAEMSYGYKESELGTLDEALLRYREGISALVSEKIATGKELKNPVTAVGTTVWGSLTLAGIIPGDNSSGNLAEVKAGDPVFLRSAPVVFYTISDGRWSNPGTWDEGVQPSSADSTVIRNTVHVGFRRDNVDGTTANGKIPEMTGITGYAGLAKQIRITNIAGSSLIFGDLSASSNTDEDNVTWETASAGKIINQNNAGQTFTNFDETDLGILAGNATDYNGLIIFGDTGGTSLSLKANQLVNRGKVAIGENAVFEACLP